MGDRKYIVKARIQETQKGNSIKSYANDNGIPWKGLDYFNWETINPHKINQFLRDVVGCTHLTDDGNNYKFMGDEKTTGGGTGYIWIPEIGSYETDNLHSISVEVPEEPYLSSDCAVVFRPKHDWQGEYGFDWMRDQFHFPLYNYPAVENNEFEKIVGFHFEDAAFIKPILDVNGHSGNFQGNLPTYQKLERNEYRKGADIRFSDGKNYPNYASFLSVYLKDSDVPKSVEIQAWVVVGGSPLQELKFEIEEKNKSFLSVTTSGNLLNIAPGNNKLILFINFDKTLSSVIEIKAVAITKKPDRTKLTTVVGRLLVVPNDKSHRKIQRIVIVNILLDQLIIGGAIRQELNENNLKKNAVKYLHQALIHPEIDFVEIDVKADNTLMNKLRNSYINASGKLIGYKRHDRTFIYIDKLINEKLKTISGKKYDKFIKVFYWGFKGGKIELDKHGNENFILLNGYSTGNHVVLFKIENNSTLTHEILHSLTLDHTFYNLAKYTYMVYNTENIMDYLGNSAYHPDSRISLYHWQWIIANNKAENEPIKEEPEFGDFPPSSSEANV